MRDIVTDLRAREAVYDLSNRHGIETLDKRAADEIERLREEVASLTPFASAKRGDQ